VRIGIITSRWQSKRLPGKALLKIQGKPLLQHIVDRARGSTLDDVVVATTLSSYSIIKYCMDNQINYYAYQNDENVLGRLLETAHSYKADTIVYLWGDCPFIDPVKIDKGLEYFEYDPFYFFDMSQPMAIMKTSLLEELSQTHLSKHKKEYIHDHIMKNIWRPKVEINSKEDLVKANEIERQIRQEEGTVL